MNIYNIAETTNVSGKCFDFISESDIQNGSVLAKGSLAENERNIYTAEIPAVGDEVFLAADPAWSYEKGSPLAQNENRYIIPAGKPFRVYGLIAANHDRFAVEDCGITPAEGSQSVSVGEYVGVDGTAVKLKSLGSTEPDDDSRGFIGKVIAEDCYGFIIDTVSEGGAAAVGRKLTIEVIRNEKRGS